MSIENFYSQIKKFSSQKQNNAQKNAVFKTHNGVTFIEKENFDYAMNPLMIEILEYWNENKNQYFMMNENVQKIIEIVKLAILEKQKFMK